MSVSLIVYAVIAIAVFGAVAGMFRAFNGPKVEEAKADQEKEDTAQKQEQTKQQKQRQESRDERRDDRQEAKKDRWGRRKGGSTEV